MPDAEAMKEAEKMM